MKPWQTALLAGGAALLGVGLLARRAFAGAAARTLLLSLPDQPFPDSGMPGALVHTPAGLPGDGPLDLVVYVRGWGSCVAVVAGDAPGPCVPGGRMHQPSGIVAQFDAVGAPGVLLLPELRVETDSGDPGQLASAAHLRGFVAGALAAVDVDPARIGRAYLLAHSGGYAAVAAMLRTGVLPVAGVGLLDALYGEVAAFRTFATAGGRLAVVTATSETAGNAAALQASLAGLPNARFERVAIGHSAVPAATFAPTLRWLLTGA